MTTFSRKKDASDGKRPLVVHDLNRATRRASGLTDRPDARRSGRIYLPDADALGSLFAP